MCTHSRNALSSEEVKQKLLSVHKQDGMLGDSFQLATVYPNWPHPVLFEDLARIGQEMEDDKDQGVSTVSTLVSEALFF